MRISTGSPPSTVTVIPATNSWSASVATASCSSLVSGNGSSTLLHAVPKPSVSAVPFSTVQGPPISWITLCPTVRQGLPFPSKGFSERGSE